MEFDAGCKTKWRSRADADGLHAARARLNCPPRLPGDSSVDKGLLQQGAQVGKMENNLETCGTIGLVDELLHPYS